MKRLLLFILTLGLVGSLEAQIFQGPIESKVLSYTAAVQGPTGKLDSIRMTRLFKIYYSGPAINAADSLFVYSSDTSNVSHGDTLIYSISNTANSTISPTGVSNDFPMGFDISPMPYLYVRLYSQQTTAGRRIIVLYR